MTYKGIFPHPFNEKSTRSVPASGFFKLSHNKPNESFYQAYR